MLKIVYSPESMENLSALKKRLEYEFDEGTSLKVVRAIMGRINHLINFPLMGMSLRTVIQENRGYRYFYVKKNYVFYRVEGRMIYIINIIDSRQEYMDILFKNNKQNS